MNSDSETSLNSDSDPNENETKKIQYLYIVTPEHQKFVKIGYWSGRIGSLISRYKLYYAFLSIYLFETIDMVYNEKYIKEYFKSHNISGELFKIEILNDMLDMMHQVSLIKCNRIKITKPTLKCLIKLDDNNEIIINDKPKIDSEPLILPTHKIDEYYMCKRCNYRFTTKQNLNYHLTYVKCKLIHKCELCNKIYTTKTHLNSHFKTNIHKYKELILKK